MSPSGKVCQSHAKTRVYRETHLAKKTGHLEGHTHLLPPHSLLSATTCGKTLSLSSIFTVGGGLASLEGVPQGTLSHTHLGSDTVALNETRRSRLGLAFQSQTCTQSPCGNAMLDYTPPLPSTDT